MTTRSNRSVPTTAVVCGACAGAGTARVAAPAAVLTPADGVDDRGVLVGFDSGSFDELGQLCEAPGWFGGYRSPVGVGCGGS